MIERSASLVQVYSRAVREGLIAGALCSIWGLILYTAGRDWFASPLMLVGIVGLFAWIILRFRYLSRNDAWLLSAEHVFGFLFAAFAVGTFLHDWITWLLLTKIDPALNSYLIAKEVSVAKAYFKEIQLPERQIADNLLDVRMAADLGNVETLMQNYISELIIGLVVMGGFSFLLRSKAREVIVEPSSSKKPVIQVSKLPGQKSTRSQ